MSSNLKIKVIKNQDWQVYRDTRLVALKDSPDAFGSTFEQASKIPDSGWQTRIQQLDLKTNLPLMAFVDAKPAGMIWSTFHEQEPDTAYIYQMWVAPEFRGLGISRTLLSEAITWATKKRAGQVKLAVTLGDTPARKLYDSAGFVAYGETEPLRENSKLKVQNMLLKLN